MGEKTESYGSQQNKGNTQAENAQATAAWAHSCPGSRKLLPGFAWFKVFRGGSCGKRAVTSRCCWGHLWNKVQLLNPLRPNSATHPQASGSSKRVANAKGLDKQGCFNQCSSKWDPWPSSINITWEAVRNAGSQASPRPTRSEILGGRGVLRGSPAHSDASYSLRTTSWNRHFLQCSAGNHHREQGKGGRKLVKDAHS